MAISCSQLLYIDFTTSTPESSMVPLYCSNFFNDKRWKGAEWLVNVSLLLLFLFFLFVCVHVYVHKVHFPVPKCVRGQRLSSRGLPCFWNRVSHEPRACHFGEASWAVSSSDPPVPIPSAGVTDACFRAWRLCGGRELRSSCPCHALHPWHHFPSQHLLTSCLPSWKYPIIIQADWLSAHFYLPMSVFPPKD